MLQSLPFFQLTWLTEMSSVSPHPLGWAKCCFPLYGVNMAFTITVFHEHVSCNRLAWYISPDCLSNNWFHWSSTVLMTQQTCAIFNWYHPMEVIVPYWGFSSTSRLRLRSLIVYTQGQSTLDPFLLLRQKHVYICKHSGCTYMMRNNHTLNY